MNALIGLVADDSAATMAEYAIITALVAVVCFVAVRAVGQSTSQLLFQQVIDSL